MNQNITENLNNLKSNILKVCKKVNRNPSSINIVAVSKEQSEEKIMELIKAGHRCFGENRLEEKKNKWSSLEKKNLEFHYIGALQSKKVKNIIKLFDVIETLDTESSAKKLANMLISVSKPPKIFLQINLGREEIKRGIFANDVELFLKMCKEKYNLSIEGAMCLPPKNQNVKKYFYIMKEICVKNSLKNISMGMSRDYIEAIECGSTNIRVGELLFGKRK